MHVVCPFCMTLNRVPPERLKNHPKCGRCHREILSGQAVILGAANFETYIGRSDLPVVVDFWADWCGPCKMVAPVIEQLAEELAGQVCFGKVDVDSEQTLAGRFNIRSIPTLMLFKSGKEVDRVMGAMNAANLRHWILSR
ncbi:thioredoxin [Methylocaldum marinum]|uniref:Thioredoxin n=2 Tax=Methylocaldum marinum TaxID=1432792 RepID=A0A250KPB4_9GAMM|nr:thioredoxin [Methylocaldum marinum]